MVTCKTPSDTLGYHVKESNLAAWSMQTGIAVAAVPVIAVVNSDQLGVLVAYNEARHRKLLRSICSSVVSSEGLGRHAQAEVMVM